MKPKKNPKTDLNRNRGLYFVLGLVAVLSLTYVALEWKTYQDPFEFTERLNVSDPLDEPVIQVDFKLPPPPPPPVAPDIIEIVPDDPDTIETPFKSTEANVDTPILAIDSIPVIDKPIDVEIPITAVEEKPIFPGCELEKDKLACFQKMIKRHVQKTQKYPDEAQEIGAQGRVDVMFTIQKDGSIGNLRMRGPHQSLEKEAARIIGKLPKMEPGKQAGQAVRVPFSIPITFKLQ